MEMYTLTYKSFKMEEKQLRTKKCKEGIKSEIHKKKRPVCKDVTKQNCVTKWEVKPNGEKVSIFFTSHC